MAGFYEGAGGSGNGNNDGNDEPAEDNKLVDEKRRQLLERGFAVEPPSDQERAWQDAFRRPDEAPGIGGETDASNDDSEDSSSDDNGN